jgi:hypothetical protein
MGRKIGVGSRCGLKSKDSIEGCLNLSMVPEVRSVSLGKLKGFRLRSKRSLMTAGPGRPWIGTENFL